MDVKNTAAQRASVDAEKNQRHADEGPQRGREMRSRVLPGGRKDGREKDGYAEGWVHATVGNDTTGGGKTKALTSKACRLTEKISKVRKKKVDDKTKASTDQKKRPFHPDFKDENPRGSGTEGDTPTEEVKMIDT